MSWKSMLKTDPVPWLLESNTYTRYKTLTDLLDRASDDEDVLEAKQALYTDSQVGELLKSTLNWFPESVTRHNVPSLSHY